MTSSQNPQEVLIFRIFIIYGSLIGLVNLAIAHASVSNGLSVFDIFQIVFILGLLIFGIITFRDRAFGVRWAGKLNASIFRPNTFWWVLSICAVMIWSGFILLLAYQFAENSPQNELWMAAIPAIRLMMLFGFLGLAYLLLQAYILGELESLMTKFHVHAAAVGIMLAGAVVRLMHLLFIDLKLPYISGGLFMEFSRQISANGFRLPEIIPYYSNGGIPYAYPPLAFIVQALLLDVGRIDPIVMGNVFAPLMSLLSLPLFYLLIREWKFSPAEQLSALLVFAMMPSVFQQQVESQGTAEVFGGITLLIYGIFLLRMWHSNSWGNVFLAGFSWALTVSSSPGSGYYATLLFFLLSVAYLRRNGKKGLTRSFLRLLALGLTAVVLSALYWGPVVEFHSFKIFFNAFGAQHEGGVLGSMFANLASLGISFNLADSPLSIYWNILIVIGVVVAFTKKRWGLLVAFVQAIMIPRENSWLFPITGAVLGGLSLSDLIFPGISRLGMRINQRKRIVMIVLIASFGLYFTTFNNVLNVDLQLDEYNREHWAERLEAYSWAKVNLPKQAVVLALTDVFSSEWAPFLMERTVVNVLQGLEWQPEEYVVVYDLLIKLPDCLRWKCVTELVENNFSLEDYFIFLDSRDYPVLAEYIQETDVNIRVIWAEDEMVWLKVDSRN